MTARASAGLIAYKLPQPVCGSGVSDVDAFLVKLSDQDGARGLGFSYVIGGNGGATLLQ
jgi:hypothetical protein